MGGRLRENVSGHRRPCFQPLRGVKCQLPMILLAAAALISALYQWYDPHLACLSLRSWRHWTVQGRSSRRSGARVMMMPGCAYWMTDRAVV